MALAFNRKRSSISGTEQKEENIVPDMTRFRNRVLLAFSFPTTEVRLSVGMEKSINWSRNWNSR